LKIKNIGERQWDSDCSLVFQDDWHQVPAVKLPALEAGQEGLIVVMIPGIKVDGNFGMNFAFQTLDANGAKIIYGKPYEMKLTIELSEKQKKEAEEKKKVVIEKPKKVYQPFVVDKAKIIIGMFGTNEEKTIEYVDNKKYHSIEDLIDDCLKDQIMKSLLWSPLKINK